LSTPTATCGPPTRVRETVTAVAYRWGFASSSRFAAYYRQAYGIHPSAMLRR
jgi:AraC-like DNA-binding protein